MRLLFQKKKKSFQSTSNFPCIWATFSYFFLVMKIFYSLDISNSAQCGCFARLILPWGSRAQWLGQQSPSNKPPLCHMLFRRGQSLGAGALLWAILAFHWSYYFCLMSFTSSGKKTRVLWSPSLVTVCHQAVISLQPATISFSSSVWSASVFHWK